MAGARVRVWYLSFFPISIKNIVMFFLLTLIVLELGLWLWLALEFC